MSRGERYTIFAIFLLSGLISYAVINAVMSQPVVEPYQPKCRYDYCPETPCE